MNSLWVTLCPLWPNLEVCQKDKMSLCHSLVCWGASCLLPKCICPRPLERPMSWDKAAPGGWGCSQGLAFPQAEKGLVSDPVREVSGAQYSEQPRFGLRPSTEWQTRRNTFREGKEPCQGAGGPATGPAGRQVRLGSGGQAHRGWTRVSLDDHFRGLNASLHLTFRGQSLWSHVTVKFESALLWGPAPYL